MASFDDYDAVAPKPETYRVADPSNRPEVDNQGFNGDEEDEGEPTGPPEEDDEEEDSEEEEDDDPDALAKVGEGFIVSDIEEDGEEKKKRRKKHRKRKRRNGERPLKKYHPSHSSKLYL
jgi:transcription elongation factor SPT6